VLLCVLMCCGGGYALIGFGMNVVAEDIRMQLRDHPTIQEHIGEMESLDVNFTASMAHPDDDTFIYEASGSKAKGNRPCKASRWMTTVRTFVRPRYVCQTAKRSSSIYSDYGAETELVILAWPANRASRMSA